jgi:hypothetical protein
MARRRRRRADRNGSGEERGEGTAELLIECGQKLNGCRRRKRERRKRKEREKEGKKGRRRSLGFGLVVMWVVNFGDLGSTAGWKTWRSFVVVIVVWDDCALEKICEVNKLFS